MGGEYENRNRENDLLKIDLQNTFVRRLQNNEWINVKLLRATEDRADLGSSNGFTFSGVGTMNGFGLGLRPGEHRLKNLKNKKTIVNKDICQKINHNLFNNVHMNDGDGLSLGGSMGMGMD